MALQRLSRQLQAYALKGFFYKHRIEAAQLVLSRSEALKYALWGILLPLNHRIVAGLSWILAQNVPSVQRTSSHPQEGKTPETKPIIHQTLAVETFGDGEEVDIGKLKQVALEIIKSNVTLDEVFTFEAFRRMTLPRGDDEVRRFARLNDKEKMRGLRALAQAGNIEVLTEGFRLKDDNRNINRARQNIEKISKQSGLPLGINYLTRALHEIFESASIYLVDEDLAKLVSRRVGRIEESSYAEFSPIQGLLREIVENFNLDKQNHPSRSLMVHEYNLGAEQKKLRLRQPSWASAASLQHDQELFELPDGPGRVLGMPVVDFEDKLVAIVTANMWVAKNDPRLKSFPQLSYVPLFSPPFYLKNDLTHTWSILDRIKSELLNPFVSFLQARKSIMGEDSLRQLWQSEYEEWQRERALTITDKRMEMSRLAPAYDTAAEQKFWDWVFSGRGLEAKIGGKIVSDHRREMVMAAVGRVREALEALAEGENLIIEEDACGESPLVIGLVKALQEQYPPGVDRLQIRVRDLSPVAVAKSQAAVARAGLEAIIKVEAGNMFECSSTSDETVSFAISCMGYYCDEDSFKISLAELARKCKKGAYGWFSILEQGKDIGELRRATVAAYWDALPWWQKYLFPLNLIGGVRMLYLLYQRWRAGAFEYGKLLKEGFEKGKYYAPGMESVEKNLQTVELKCVSQDRSLAQQFLLVSWQKPIRKG